MKRWSNCFLVAACAVSLLGANGDNARFTDLGHRMMCVCGCNQILLECNHVGCTYSDKMREQLASAVQNDSSDENVLQAFIREYGTTVLAAPTGRGFDRVAWIMPFAVLLAAIAAAAMMIRSWTAREYVEAASGTLSALASYRDQARRETEL